LDQASRKRRNPARKKTAKKPVVKKPSVKKKIVKKTQKPVAQPKLKPAQMIDPSLVQVGVISHYFDRIKVCVVKLTQGTILIGDKLTILGVKTKFVQKVWSMQIESNDVKVAKKGNSSALKWIS